MAERPWMPIYWGDYLADTPDLGVEEHGAYLLLIGLAWRRPDGALPNDMGLLRRMLAGYCSGMHGNRFNRIVPKLLERFWSLGSDGKWHQKRIEKERENAEKRSRNAQENAKKRWGDTRQNNELADAPALLTRASTITITEEESKTPPSATETMSLTQTPPHGGNGHDKPKSDRGSRLPEDWRPSEAAIAYCRTELGCTAEILNREYQMFMDWGLSAVGPASRKRDWNRAFVNWMRRVTLELREQESRERRWAERRAGAAH